jgi:hypothetical protein
MKTSKWLSFVYLGGVLWLSGCSATNGIFGGTGGSAPPGTPPASSTVDVRGTIDENNTQARTLTIATDSSYQGNLRSAGRKVLAYNSATVVQYQGQTYHAEDLERGDRIEARAESDGNTLWARNVTVLSSVSGDISGNPDLRDFEATVRSVNASNRTIDLVPASGSGRVVTVGYDSGTRVDYQGRAFRPQDLESGDQVRVTTHGSADRVIADRVSVLRNVGQNGGGSPQAQLHGTIRYVDTNSRTIALDNVSGAQSFNPDANGRGATINYDSGTVVEYRGQRYGIANLEAGDVVDIDIVNDAGNRRLARRIVVASAS